MYSVNLAEPVPSSRNINAAVKHKKMNKSSDAPQMTLKSRWGFFDKQIKN